MHAPENQSTSHICIKNNNNPSQRSASWSPRKRRPHPFDAVANPRAEQTAPKFLFRTTRTPCVPTACDLALSTFQTKTMLLIPLFSCIDRVDVSACLPACRLPCCCLGTMLPCVSHFDFVAAVTNRAGTRRGSHSRKPIAET